jgi:hypothetical protein
MSSKPKGPAERAWDSAINAKRTQAMATTGKPMPMGKAIELVTKEQPAVHKAYLAEVNAAAGHAYAAKRLK